MGEYGSLAPRLPGGRALTVPALLRKLCTAVLAQKPSDATKGFLLTACCKIVAQNQVVAPPADVTALMKQLEHSRSVDLQQRAQQVQLIMR